METILKSKVYLIEIEIDGIWRSYDGFEYLASVKEDIKEMNRIISACKKAGYKTRKHFVCERDYQVLSAT